MHPEGSRTTYTERERIRAVYREMVAAGTESPVAALAARFGWDQKTIQRVVGYNEPKPSLLADRWEAELVRWRAECRSQPGAHLAGVHPELPADWKYYRAGR